MDRRRAARIDLQLQCQVSRPDQPGRSWYGVTENISRGGTLVRCARTELDADSISVGEKYHLVVRLPADHSFSCKYLYSQVCALRLQEEGEEIRVAFQFHWVEFQDADSLNVLTDAAVASDLVM